MADYKLPPGQDADEIEELTEMISENLDEGIDPVKSLDSWSIAVGRKRMRLRLLFQLVGQTNILWS